MLNLINVYNALTYARIFTVVLVGQEFFLQQLYYCFLNFIIVFIILETFSCSRILRVTILLTLKQKTKNG